MKTLELSEHTKQRIAKLQEISEKAESGDKDARRELRRALRSSTPDVIARASDIGRRGQRLLINTAAAGDPLVEEALVTRMDLMREEIAGENPTPLEVLLTERVVACWILVELFEALSNAQLQTGKKTPRVSPSYMRFMLRWQESTNRRYLAAIRELARIRKLEAHTSGVQVNTQINVRSESIMR